MSIASILVLTLLAIGIVMVIKNEIALRRVKPVPAKIKKARPRRWNGTYAPDIGMTYTDLRNLPVTKRYV